MKRGERIPLHDHSDRYSGGPIHGPSIVRAAGLAPQETGGSGSSGGGGAESGNFELNVEGGQSVINAIGSSGSAFNIDPSDGNVQTVTLTASGTATLLTPTGGAASTLELWATQDGTGGRSLAFATDGGTFTWDGGTPTPVTTASVTVRYILDWVPGSTNDWVGVLVAGSSGVSGGTPALTLGTANATGTAATAILTDASIAVFDGTAPTTFAPGGTASVGTAAVAARRDHVHGITTLLIADTHSTPIVFADVILNEAGDDFLYGDP